MYKHTFNFRLSFVQTFDSSENRQLDQHNSNPIFLLFVNVFYCYFNRRCW